MESDIQQITRAFLFAAQKHTDQRRKGARQEPYLNHLVEGAEMIARHTGGKNVAAVVAYILHDTKEDTDTTEEELRREFGDAAASVVMECSDDKALPKAERKRLQVLNAPHKSDDAKLVKIADKTSNCRSVMVSPPEGWSPQQQEGYFVWAKRVVDGCRGVNAGMEKEFDDLWQAGMTALKAPKPVAAP